MLLPSKKDYFLAILAEHFSLELRRKSGHRQLWWDRLDWVPPSATQPAAQHLPELFLERTMTWCKSPIGRTAKQSPLVRMNGVPIPQVRTHKHLGLVFNNTLTWNDHVSNVYSTCARMLGILRRLDGNISPLCMERMYKTVLISYAGDWPTVAIGRTAKQSPLVRMNGVPMHPPGQDT